MILGSFIKHKKTFALEHKGKVIGSLGIEEYSEENYPELDVLKGREIGYVLSKAYWGQGLMPEAAKAVINWLFNEEKLDFIIVGHFDRNAQSKRVVEKCGFQYGVLVPAIARPREDGGYELIAGHRRKHACELAGRETMPVIVRDLDRNAAIIIMVDSNLQRESILPSEKAKAYKMKLEAIKRQGKRHDLTSTQPVSKLRSNEELSQLEKGL